MGFRRYQNGFRIGYTGGQLNSTVENMPSARAHGHAVVEYLAKELKRGSITGPFFSSPSSQVTFQQIWFGPKI